MRGIIWETLGDQFRQKKKTKKQVLANEHLRALGHSVSILFYLQVKEGCVNHLASTFDA